MATRPTFKPALDVLTSVVLITAAVTLIYRNVSTEPRGRANLSVPGAPQSLDGAVIRGSKEAKAVMVVFSDFECPYCARFTRDVLPEIERRYVTTGQVALAFRHLPLPIHAQATRAAEMAEWT